jgi:Flp pilus assembly pilin Flp
MVHTSLAEVTMERRKRLSSDTRGVTFVEYIILISAVAIAGIAAWQQFGDSVANHVRGSTVTFGNLPASEVGDDDPFQQL